MDRGFESGKIQDRLLRFRDCQMVMIDRVRFEDFVQGGFEGLIRMAFWKVV